MTMKKHEMRKWNYLYLGIVVLLLISCASSPTVYPSSNGQISGELRSSAKQGIRFAQTAGSVSALTWDAPTTNVDGSLLTDLAGFKVYWGLTSGSYSSVKDVGMAGVGNGNLVGGVDISSLGWPQNTTYYVVLTAYDTYGNESSYSNQVSGFYDGLAGSPFQIKVQ
jgi:uncharacterized protein YfaP (DUF2135 family)